MAKEKSSYKMNRSKPTGTGNTRLKFNEKAPMGPSDDAKKANPKLEMNLFSKDALGAEIPPNGKYAAKSKKGFYDEKCFDSKANEMLPTEDY